MKLVILLLCCLAFISTKLTAQRAGNNAQLEYFELDSSESLLIDSLYNSLTSAERIGQMIFLSVGKNGRSMEELNQLLNTVPIGGIILLGGFRSEYLSYQQQLDSLNNSVPLLYSIDAEPSLMPYKLYDYQTFKATSLLRDSAEIDSVLSIIHTELEKLNVTINYAPVADLSRNREIIGQRSFGADTDYVMKRCMDFISISLRDGVLPVIKHFPGHGYVQGDSHKKLVYIDGEMQEVPVFDRLIKAGAPAVMVGHIAIENNEYASDLPATCSQKLVQGLLRDSLGFEGLIITDAFNMGALQGIEGASFKAVEAGCDIILMPTDPIELFNAVIEKVKEDEKFALRIEKSVKRILRLKVKAGLIH